jgi:opacity protein-like surface antigen
MRFRLATVAALILATTLTASNASAQYIDRDDNVRFAEEFKTDEFMILLRTRAVTIPGFVMGLWFDEHARHWSNGQRNLSYGGEFVWRKGKEYEFSVGLDYADLTMPEAFWREKDKGARASEWTTIDLKVFSMVFSAYWFWDVTQWFAPFVGGGIGPGFIMGDITKAKPRRDTACYSQLDQMSGSLPDVLASPACFNASGEVDPNAFEPPVVENRVPPVVPILNATVGTRFNLGRHGVLKLETGFYTYFYAGMSIGAQW